MPARETICDSGAYRYTAGALQRNDSEMWGDDAVTRSLDHRPGKRARLLTCSLGALALGLAASHAAPAAAAEEPAFLALSAGAFDILDDETTAEFRAEYRSDLRLWRFAPFVGAMANADGGVYGYAGLGVDIFLGERIVLTPNAAFGLYYEGDSKDLGGAVEFRTGGELAYRFDDKSRLGIAFHHISNASIYDDNPGTESLVLTYAIPIGVGVPP